MNQSNLKPIQKLNAEKWKWSLLLFVSQLCYNTFDGYFCNHVKYLICSPDTFCETQGTQKICFIQKKWPTKVGKGGVTFKALYGLI